MQWDIFPLSGSPVVGVTYYAELQYSTPQGTGFDGISYIPEVSENPGVGTASSTAGASIAGAVNEQICSYVTQDYFNPDCGCDDIYSTNIFSDSLRLARRG